MVIKGHLQLSLLQNSFGYSHCLQHSMQSITLHNHNIMSTPTISKEKPNKLVSRVLILGGTGRVGASTATALSHLCPGLQLKIGGRNRKQGTALVSSLGENSEFVELDIYNQRMLKEALEGVDVVVHAAGPFKVQDKCAVLKAAISSKTAYVDVCDNTDYALRAKGLHEKAIAAGIPAITTAGICPGVSNVMAAKLVDAARNRDGATPESLRFSYYVAGSGGVGPTMLLSCMYLLDEEAIAYDKGKEVKLKPYSGVLNIDFGEGIGKKDAYLLNLPEVRSAHQILKVPTVSARFGSDPFFWNWAMQASARFLPKEFLRDKNKVFKIVQSIDPLVRIVDEISGQSLSMRVDLNCTDGKKKVGLFTHKKLSVSAGYAAAAFVLAVLEGSTKPGVWFPEEPEGIAVDARKVLLERATQGTSNFVMQ
ncbi:hypothetical protein LUZ62_064491 [Rhynchospora pubera]|uniref:Saccharopine dehydrogenase NADP binding domain-containing protein n=1 Tax=Rhynchospora pubera TaxID=906938 RepID=A0AAV8DQU4_9POAL|nr:hypothetical protein LUZ62_056125 [Rhynchospora pubera]KAJ4780234.1 hypothetical protein LUZ62_064491 [Rhynchospora pubera]